VLTSSITGAVCFEVDEAGEVFDYGRVACDTSVAYCSVVLFGTIPNRRRRARAKQRFFDALMAKYGKPDSGRPEAFLPAPRRGSRSTPSAPERITGKGNAPSCCFRTVASQGSHQVA